MSNGSNKQIIQIGGGGGGSGDVVGPASSTDNAIARYDSTTGKIIQNSAVTIDDTGRVGVGNSGVAQSYLVDVNNSTGDALLRVKDSDSIYQGVVLSSDTNGGYITNSNIGTSIGEGVYLQNSTQAIRFYTAGTEKARIDSTGKVGIGVTPSAPLDVVGSTSGDLLVQAQNTNANGISSFVAKDNGGTRFLTFGVNNTTMSLGTQYGIAGEGIIRSSGSATGIAVSASTGPIRFLQTASGLERMRIDTGGNVGIGVTPTAQKLEVAGNIKGDRFIGYGGGAITNNSAVGVNSLLSNTTGVGNTANGVDSLRSNLGGSYNTANGVNALFANTTGDNNTATGVGSLQTNSTGRNNSAYGYNSLYDLNTVAVTGNNTAVGFNTGRGITTGVNNTIIGASVTGLSPTLSNNIIIADGSGNRRINVDATGNVGIGLLSPTAALQIKAGTATANTAPLKFDAGVNLTTIENGAVEYDGTHLYVSIGGVRYQIDQQAVSIPSTAISDFNSASRAQTEAELVAGTNITITPSGTGATRQLTIASTGGGGTLTVQDEGSTTSTTVTTLNFTGAGVTASGAGATATINIGGGGGSSTKGIAEVDFGAITQESDIATVTVIGASISTTSYPSVTMYGLATADHDPDDYMAEGLTAYITNIINGVSFDIAVTAPNLTWGKYKVTYLY